MIVHLTHALILTQFEADLLNTLEWDEIIAQDFTVHALYCSDTNEILFHSDNQNSNPTDKISEINKIILQIGNGVEFAKQILVCPPEINEYDSMAIKGLLH